MLAESFEPPTLLPGIPLLLSLDADAADVVFPPPGFRVLLDPFIFELLGPVIASILFSDDLILLKCF